MNIETVGTENLPNVYIDEIFIYSNGDPLLNYVDQRIVVRLNMHDHHPSPSWRRPEMADLQVKIVFISGDSSQVSDTIDKLNDGQISLHDYKVDSTDNAGHGINVVIVGAQDFVPAGGDSENYRKFKKTVEVTMNQPEFLNVYAACFIPDLNLGNDLLNRFYGPMVAEKIYVGGVINKESSYFYYPDSNVEYGGPVHAHEQTWMEGSQHVTKPHKKLRQVIEENYKIKIVSGITDPNEFLPGGSGTSMEDPVQPQSGAGSEWEREALEGIVEDLEGNLVNMDPIEEIDENPNNNPGSNFDPDADAGGY
jgi:hypothetical protein